MRFEAGNMFRDPIRKAKLAFLDQRPDRRRRDDLGVRKQRKQSLLIDRARGIDRRAAKAAVERELAMPAYGHLSAWMKAAGDMGQDDLACALEFRAIEAERFGAGCRNKRGARWCVHG
jgi:hypothetical protein